MYELIQAGERSYYINCPAKVGIYLSGEGEVYLVDGGSDKDAGRRIRRILDQKGWRLKGILVTHSHADHIGGCRYLQAQTGCPVFAGGIEAAFTAHPALEPAFLWGGYPFRELQNKFLMAQECEVSDFSHPEFPREIEIIPLPGHFFDMVGFRMPDGVVFLADCISSPETLEKYAVPFIYDVQAWLDTLNRLETMQATLFVPAHAEAAGSMGEPVRINREKILEIAGVLREICAEPLNFEVILQRLFARYGLAMNAQQYVLVGSTVKSFLSWMKEAGQMQLNIENGLLLWQAV